MSTNKFQIVGSLLRPAKLLEYKTKIEHTDNIQYPFYDEFPGYKEAEAEAFKQAIKSQKENGITVITDGEQARSLWHLDFIWGLSGVERFIEEHGYTFEDKDGGLFETSKDIGIRITGPLSGKNHHFIKLFEELKAEAGEDTQLKVTVVSIAHAFTELSLFKGLYGENQFYKTKQELQDALVNSYKEFLVEYKEAGGEIIQFDDCLWELFSDDNDKSYFGDDSPISLDDLTDEFVALNNLIIDFGHSLGLKVWTHNCRGNYASRHAAGGSYSSIAEKFLKNQKYDRFFLEWDDDRAGDISALEAVKDKENVEVVLGLLSSKTSTLDDEERTIKLLDKAASIIPKERLFLSHQCGFASCDCGNELSIAQQWAKIKQGQEIAKKYFGE